MTNAFRRANWEIESLGPMTEQAIRLFHDGHGKFRISRYTYAAGDKIEGRCKTCRVYVLNGNVAFSSEGGALLIGSGEAFTFHGGSYTIKVSESAGADVIWVWEMPSGFG